LAFHLKEIERDKITPLKKRLYEKCDTGDDRGGREVNSSL